jgi:aspartate-semialdehyde dehydrogenase
MGYTVAVVGATGNVGREALDILAERGFPADTVLAVASRKSAGQDAYFGDTKLKVVALDSVDFSKIDIAIMSAGGDISREWAPKIGAGRLRRHRQLLRIPHGQPSAADRAGSERRCD